MRLKYVPTLPTNPPTISSRHAVPLVRPSNRTAKRPGNMKEIIVPVTHPTRFRTSPREGAARARPTVRAHSASVNRT